jgi:sugar transferase (PEP-CTERM system associated)
MIRLFNHYVRLPFLMLGLVEFIVCFLSLYAAVFLRFSGEVSASDTGLASPVVLATLYAAVMTTAMIAMGLYQSQSRVGASSTVLRLALSFVFGGAFLILLFYVFPSLYIGRGVMIVGSIIAFFVMGTLRPLFFGALDENLLKRRVVIYGAGERASMITRYLRRKTDQRGYTIAGFVHIDGQPDVVPPDRILHMDSSLSRFVVENDIDEIVVAIDDRRKSFPVDELLSCKMGGVDVIDIQTFFERETGKVELELLQPSWLVYSEGFRQNLFRDAVKRLFDITASSLFLFFTWPVVAVTALAIKLEDGWDQPLFYSQERVGLDGKPYSVYKLRSMRTDAEKDGAVWAIKNDTRVTRVGAFIRKTRIDEIPQIWNVLRGDMSFVGPRPERPQFVERLKEIIPYYDERHRVKPGITGWAQLMYPYGASEQDALQKQKYDLYYTKNCSLILDLLILIQTVEVVLFGKGAR